MTSTQAKPRKVGRPVEGPGTVRILPTGVIRLSPDLCTAKTFSVAADAEKKQLTIRPDGLFEMWYSGPRAKSGLLAITTAFELLGMDPKRIAGEYAVRPLKAGFVVDLSEK
jgi:hypothetical protein